MPWVPYTGILSMSQTERREYVQKCLPYDYYSDEPFNPVNAGLYLVSLVGYITHSRETYGYTYPNNSRTTIQLRSSSSSSFAAGMAMRHTRSSFSTPSSTDTLMKRSFRRTLIQTTSFLAGTRWLGLSARTRLPACPRTNLSRISSSLC